MKKEGLIYICEDLMALNETIKRFCPADAPEVPLARNCLRAAYEHLRAAMGEPAETCSQGETNAVEAKD